MKYFILMLLFVFAGCSNESYSIKKDNDIPVIDDVDNAVDEDVVNPDIIEIDEDGVETDDDIFFDEDNYEISDEDATETEDEIVSDEDIESAGFPECTSYERPVSAAVLKDENLKEISGVAVSYLNKGVLWVHNDSGSSASLFAIKYDGTIVAELVVNGATNIDWEDMSLNPCGEDECFYVADTGDNLLNRTDYAIYEIKEPNLSETDETTIISNDWIKYPINYEDGSKNSEALAIDVDGTLYLFSKEIGITNIYKADMLNESGTKFVYAGFIDTGEEVSGYPAEAQPSLVTGADINRNGTRLLLRTYGIYTTDDDGIREFEFEKGNIGEFLTEQPVLSVFVPEGQDMQGESVAYDPYTGGYVHISEYYYKYVDFNPKIWVVDCSN